MPRVPLRISVHFKTFDIYTFDPACFFFHLETLQINRQISQTKISVTEMGG